MKAVPLGKVAEIVSGATPKTSVDHYWGGDILWVTPANLTKLNAAYISDTPRKLTRAGLVSCGAKLLPAGSVLLSSRAPIGHVAINARSMATNQGFKSLVPHVDSLDAKYLYYFLRSNTAYLQSLGNGATFKEISKATVSRVEIPLPEIEEQRRIAGILDQADTIRAKRRHAFAHLESLTQSIFREMFGDPPASSPGIAVDPLHVWVDPDRPITYGILKPGLDQEDGVPYVRVTDMKDRGIDLRGIRRTSSKIAHEYRRSTLQSGDLIMSIRGHVGRFASVPPELSGANITQDSARLAVKDPDAASYVRAAMESPSMQHWMARRTRGAAVKGINLGDLRELPLPVPSSERLRLFASRVGRVDAQLALVQRALDADNELFASLQARAFRGEL